MTGYQHKAPDGYITGKEAGDIIVEELSDACLKRKRYYYKGADVRSLCQTFVENMREIFEEDTAHDN